RLVLALPRPNADNHGREHENEERIEGEEPRRGDFTAPEADVNRTVSVVLDPKQNRIALLIVCGPDQRYAGADADDREHQAALGGGERYFCPGSCDLRGASSAGSARLPPR